MSHKELGQSQQLIRKKTNRYQHRDDSAIWIIIDFKADIIRFQEIRANNIKMWKDWSLSREFEDIKKKQKEILLLKKYPKQKNQWIDCTENGDNNKKSQWAWKKISRTT